jgi:hypothetical protein
VTAVEAEGWYRDPFNRHADRWFSDGRPTALVRDGAKEGHDPPPERPFTGALVECPTPVAVDGDDLKRADEAESVDLADAEKAMQVGIDNLPRGPFL